MKLTKNTLLTELESSIYHTRVEKYFSTRVLKNVFQRDSLVSNAPADVDVKATINSRSFSTLGLKNKKYKIE